MHKSIDTNIVLRYIVNDVPEQRLKVKHLFSEKNVKYHVADAVFVEVEFALRKHYCFEQEDIADAIEALLEQDFIVANKNLFSKVLSVYTKNPKVSFVDIMLTYYAELNNATPLMTFDKNLSKISQSVQLLN